MKWYFIPLLLICVIQLNYSQLPNGSVAPDFDVEDVYGNIYSLYAMMGNNKSACVGFEATWCGFCWHFHESHVLDQVVNNLGANTTAIMLEADWKTNTECLFGPAGCNDYTWGDWVTGVPYAVANLSANNGPTVASEYYHNYYPLLYVISPDKRTWEIVDRSYQNYSNWITKSFALTASASLTHSICGDNGKIILNVTGGFGFLTYKWNNGATTKDLNNIGGGNYSVTITDGNKYFKGFGPFIVDGPEKKVDVTQLEIEHVKCFNEASGNITVQLDYGTPSYQYKWSNGNTQNANLKLKSGNYTLTVTDNKNCSIIRSYSITQPSDLTATASTQLEQCDGQDGKIQVKGLGGYPPYFYDIGDGSQSKSEFNNLKGGKTYFITVTDANQCIEILKVEVDVSHKPKVDAGVDRPIDCKKPFILLDGTNSEKANWFKYFWTSDSINLIIGAESLTPEVNLPGTYILEITNTNNYCKNLDSVIVLDERVFPDIIASRDTLLNCIFNETELQGSSRNKDIKWYWINLLDSTFYSEDSNIIVNTAGRYVFHVKDTLNLCLSKDTVQIFEDKIKPKAEIASNQYLSCLINTLQLSASNSSLGIQFKYHWSSPNGKILSGQDSIISSIGKSGYYILEVLNTINGCIAIDSVIVLERSKPFAGFEQRIQGLELAFQDLSNGIPANWNWTFGDGAISQEQHPKHSYSNEGEYEVCLSVENDCGLDNICRKLLIGISSSLSLQTAVIKPVSCYGGGDGAITLTLSGGIPPYQYYWNNQQTGKDLVNIAAGNYSVQITDQQGSKLTKQFDVPQAEEIKLKTFEISPSVFGLNDGRIQLEVGGGNLPYHYNWSHGAATNPVLNLKPGSYSCTLTDDKFCKKDFGPFEIKELTRTKSFSNIKKFELFPNPVGQYGIISIQMNHAIPYTIQIVNMYGQTIFNYYSDMTELNLPIDFETLPNALYFVSLKTEMDVQTLIWHVNE